MTRLELEDELQGRFDRFDTDTKDFIHDWITRVVKEVEKLHPFKYTKDRKADSLTGGTNEYTFPTDLILHLPIKLRIQDEVNSDVLYRTFNVHDDFFDYWITDDTEVGSRPFYIIQRGGTNGLVYAVFPVQSSNLTTEIDGHFYSSAFTADGDSNWLTNEYPDAVLEGVAAMGHKHFEEWQNYQASREMYNSYLNGNTDLGIHGLLPSERRRAFKGSGQVPRIKFYEDLPIGTARKMRRFAI